MAIHTLLRPSLQPCPRQSKLKPEVVARLRKGIPGAVSLGSEGLKCNNIQVFQDGWLHADLKSAFRRNVALPSYRCFYQDHGAEVIQTVSDEAVLKPAIASDLDLKQGGSPFEDEAVLEVLLPTMQVQSLPTHERLVSDFSSTSAASVTPTQLRWKPSPVPEAETNFIDGLSTVCGSGSPFLRHGYAVHMYTANISMEGCAFANADGDLLIVPQLGRLWIKTEMGKLEVKPGELVVLQLGIRFAIELPDGPSRGYVVEVFSGHFQLPDLGPIGANGLADPRDFLTPKAWFEEKSFGTGGFTVIHKFGGALFDAKQDFSPFNVVAWHGNYAPYKYNLKKFCPFNTVLFDHADPSINTVLTVPSEKPGVAVVDFVVFPPRWSVAEHTFRPPYFHRNCMSEFMGLIYGMYEGKADGFVPGGASLHNCMTPHGVDTATYERTICEDPKPSKIPDHALAFMFESSLIPRVTPWALNSPQRDPDYYKCWIGLRSHFDRTNEPEAEDS